MKMPTMESELQQLLSATKWLPNSITQYAKVIEPLHELMEDSYSKAGGKRTRLAVRKILITDSWSAAYDTVSTAVKDQLAAVNLYYPYGYNPGIPRHTSSKLICWDLKLSSFRYVLEHLSGERNVWADMLTRWAVNSNSAVKIKN